MADVMLTPSQKLVKYGFIKESAKQFYVHDKEKGYFVINNEYHGDDKPKSYTDKHADEEKAEEVNMTMPFTKSSNEINELTFTGFPKPYKRYRLVFESFGLSIEETYFWVLGHIRQDMANPSVDKITDVFSASENSSYWGQANFRLGQQQEKVSNYLATIGRMLKDLFQIVREIRIIDERMEAYTAWTKSKSADVTLKSLFVELVERGVENRNSVYGLATSVGYSTLPDLFFNTKVYTTDDIDKEVNKWEINENVKNVLRKKLFQFVTWKDKTEKELTARRSFLIPYLRQHWGAIKMYMNWIKPYLKSIKRLSMNEKQIDSPDIISSFETSVTEIEILSKKDPISGCRPCVLASFKFTTKPMMQFQQDSYQARGAVHVGRVDLSLRAYAWTEEQVEGYKKYRQEEDFELLGLIDDSIKAAMDMLGDSLSKYLAEAGEKEMKADAPKDEAKPKNFGAGIMDPFLSLFKGFGDMFGVMVGGVAIGGKKNKKEKKPDPTGAYADAQGSIWNVYKNYKKSHGLLSW
jgi:hypothetical protein